MEHGKRGPRPARPVLVRVPVEPVEAAVEADAVDAAAWLGGLAVRGALYGVVAQGAGDGARWRVVVPVTSNYPQEARESLNSQLWYRAKDEARDRAERRALLAAVARLETERVDELTVSGTRYRVARAEEYAGTGPGGLEQPRPTDPGPDATEWDGAEPKIDEDLVLDLDAPVSPTQAVEQLALRDMYYLDDDSPKQARDDARRALETHPDVLLLPAAFTVVEEAEDGWKPISGPHITAHAARRSLEFVLAWAWPRLHGLISFDAQRETDARSVVEAGGDEAAELAPYAAAANRLRAGPVNRVELDGTWYQIARTRRLVRWGPDGPEGPRPSDRDGQEPLQLHPPMDEDGRILPED
ncbi:DUF5954 family protein [Streptomyces sp. NPDC000594]|uniref:DUF5954 family protein n=1 Tax=Streptomyces sp. NPDC000594 TaxID=3154261 RepID=UPI0033231422